jgi:radical SAM superfamily enzyme YgiQ (UPF0313 family)
MFKDKSFRVRPLEEVIQDLEAARGYYKRIEKIFLADGDALCLSTEKLSAILGKIRSLFPECEKVSVYGSPQDVLRKSVEELVRLREEGLDMVYIGAESGSDRVLKHIVKGATREEIISAVRRLEECGIKASVTFISGLAGKDGWMEHGKETGTMISEMEPSYVGLLTLMLEPSAPLTQEVRNGRFELLSAEEVLAETLVMLDNINVKKPCVFRSNHASNYLSLRGDLPRDKERMMGELRLAMENKGMLKDERFRML